MSYALLFSGQGGQHADMLPWLDEAAAAQPALAALAKVVGLDWRDRLRDPLARATNAFAQPVIVGAAVAAWDTLGPLLDAPPVAVAGYSVGELAAVHAAGALGSVQAIGLAARRGALMDSAVAGLDTALIAVTDAGEADVLAACPGLECAIRIDALHNVFGGARSALDDAQRALAARATVKPLCVALASHTSWMRPAQAGLEHAVREAGLRAADGLVALDATGSTTRDPAVIAQALVAQVAQCVEWGACLAAVAERKPDCVLEIGGGQALSRMWAARFPHIPVRSLDEFRTPEGAAAWIRRHA